MNAIGLAQRSNERLDYGHALEFGYFLTPDAGDPVGVLETARLVDRLGYPLIGVGGRPLGRARESALNVVAGGARMSMNGRGECHGRL